MTDDANGWIYYTRDAGTSRRTTNTTCNHEFLCTVHVSFVEHALDVSYSVRRRKVVLFGVPPIVRSLDCAQISLDRNYYFSLLTVSVKRERR